MRAIFFVLVLLLAETPFARAAAPVDVALVLVSDVSMSMVKSEFALEKKGYAQAIESPALIAAIEHGPIGAIALTYVEFSGSSEIRTVVGWHRIDDRASARAFARAMLAAPRSSDGSTAIGSAIVAAIGDLAEDGFAATRRIIDVCGDGNNNAGIALRLARARAHARGITVNGLAIIHDNPPPWLVPHVDPPGGLVAYYRDHVITGPGSFVMEVHDYRDFATAMTRKLVLEIARRSGARF